MDQDWVTDKKYGNLLRELLKNGERVKTRNDWVRRLHPYQTAITTFSSTPLVCARKTAWKSALLEWEWFMSGSYDIHDLHPSIRPWWQPWADEDGLVYHNYSQQFRSFSGRSQAVDQIGLLIDGIKDHPFSRRNVVTTWNSADMNSPLCPITNCHGTVVQGFVDTSCCLHLKTYQRSVDVVCGLPHNWLQYWAFLLWLAHRTGNGVGTLTWVGGDVHLYEEHVELAQKVVDVGYIEEPSNLVYSPTTEEFDASDFTLDGPYEPILTERARMVV